MLSTSTSRQLAKQAALLLLVLLALLCLLQAPSSVYCKRHSVAIDTKSTASDGIASDFVATEEWRVVSPGQRIPPGLHVRMNIQTGHTEARLMPPGQADGDPDVSSNLPALVANSNKPNAADETDEGDDVSGLSSSSLRQALSSRRMKEALKKIKAENLASEGGSGAGADSSSNKFRSYEDLKADFAKLNAGIKTDLEIIKELLAEWQLSLADPANRLRILSEFEYHLRQIDNAQNFIQLGGLDLLMGQVNGTDHEAAAAALRVLAACCQGNAPVQVAAVKTGFLPLLLRVMIAESGAERQTRSASVLALASLCRNFPHAQTVLLKSGGLAALRSAFEARDADRARVLRIVTLLADIALEATEADSEATKSATSTAIERQRQYQQVSAARAIAETGWCSLVPRLLDFDDHDAVEKVVAAMSILFNVCGRGFASEATTIAAVDRLAIQYERLAKEELAAEAVPGYFEQMRQRIDLLRRHFSEIGHVDSGKSEL